MTRKMIALLLAVACVSLAGCKRDTEINGFVTEFDSFTTELVNKVESAPDTEAGVDDAQKFLDSKKADLQARMESLKSIRGYQVSEDTQKKMTDSLVADAQKVAGLQMKYVNRSATDAAFKAKMDKLTSDYQSLFKV